jgi:hypothetical protein
LGQTGIFASWQWIVALAVSNYLMKASTGSATYAVSGIARYDRFRAEWNLRQALRRSADFEIGQCNDERVSGKGIRQDSAVEHAGNAELTCNKCSEASRRLVAR